MYRDTEKKCMEHNVCVWCARIVNAYVWYMYVYTHDTAIDIYDIHTYAHIASII